LICQSLLDNGILLSPENYEIPILDCNGELVDQVRATQRRACFTELEFESLPAHSVKTDKISEIENVRQNRDRRL